MGITVPMTQSNDQWSDYEHHRSTLDRTITEQRYKLEMNKQRQTDIRDPRA